MPKRYPIEQGERALKMVLDRLDGYPSAYAACQALVLKLGVYAETLRVWAKRAQIDPGKAPGVTDAEQARIEELERIVRDLKEADEILKAVIFLRGRSTRAASSSCGGSSPEGELTHIPNLVYVADLQLP